MILFDDPPSDSASAARLPGGGDTGSSSLSPRALAALATARGEFAALSDLTDRMGFGRRFQIPVNRDGISFNGARDMYRALGYADILTPYDYWARYQRGGIAERIVEAFPRLTWSGEFSIVEDEDPETLTEYEAAVADLYSRLAVPSKLMRADIMAGLGHYSAILLGTQLYEGQSLLAPLSRLPGGEADLLYLTPLDETRSKITRVVTDPSDPRFGLPETYLAILGAPIGPGYDYRTGVHAGSISLPVHYSRIVHIAEGCLSDNVYGKPRLRAVWNLLDDLLKVVGGGSEATWVRANPGIQADLDPMIAAKLGEPAKQAQADQLEEYLHGYRRWLRTVGTKLSAIGGGGATSQVPIFGPNATAILQLIAGTIGLPIRILIGSERAHLASTQDDENLRDRVAERRLEFAIPTVRELNTRCESIGALPIPDNPAYEPVWPSIEELTEDAKAKATLAMAQANQFQAAAGGGLVFTSSEIRDINYGLTPLEPADAGLESADGQAASDGPPEDPSARGDDPANPSAPGAPVEAPKTSIRGGDTIVAKPVGNAGVGNSVHFTRGRVPIRVALSSPHASRMGRRAVAQIQYAKLVLQSREEQRHRERQRGTGTYTHLTISEINALARTVEQ